MLSPRGVMVLAVFAIFLALATATTVCRVYVRARLINIFSLDDWAATVSWVFFVAFTTACSVGIRYGFDATLHPVDTIVFFLQPTWISGVFYIASSMLIKFAIAVMLLKLAQTQKVIRYALYLVTGIYEICGLFTLIEWVVQCSPPSFYWTQYEGASGHCSSPTFRIACTYLFSAVSCLMDWTLAILPWLLVRQLKSANMQTKLLVGIVLGMGSIASIATIIRMLYATRVLNNYDYVSSSTNFLIWTAVELGLSITVSSAATMRPLLMMIMRRSRSRESKLESVTLDPGQDDSMQGREVEKVRRRTPSLDFSYFEEKSVNTKEVKLDDFK